MTEAEVLVEAYGGGVGAIADDGNHLPPWSLFAMFDQGCEQGTAATARDVIWIDIDGVFHGKAVGRARAVRTCVGVADDGLLVFGNEVGHAKLQDGGAAFGHLAWRGRVELEGCGAVQDMVAVDARDDGQVVLGGRPEVEVVHLN